MTSLEDAKARISNEVYRVCLYYEKLEHDGLVRGNGHHHAQDVAKYASDKMEEYWRRNKNE